MPENTPTHPPLTDAVPDYDTEPNDDVEPDDDTEPDDDVEPDYVEKREAAPPVVLIAAAAVGAVTAFSVPLDQPGVGWLVGGIAATAGVIAIRRPTHWSQIAWGALALGLISVGTYRAAAWLFVLCAIGACVAGSLAVFGGRTVGQVLFATIVIPVRAVRDIPWLARGFTTSSRERDGERTFRTTASVIVGVLLVLVFGALFAGADPTFAHLVSAVVPSVDDDTVARWIFLFLAAAGGTAAAGHLLLAPPNTADRTVGPALRTVEWALPVGLLVLLFAMFVADQVAALFGGADYVLRTAHLTYAQYARTGFWQLLLVTGLTLVVIAVVVAKADRVGRDRVWLRALLGTLAGLTLVVVASALTRMWSYQQAYGFTVPRLCVEVCELWLGGVYLLVIAGGVRLRLGWLPRTIVATGLSSLLVLAVLNPERLIAEQNVARYDETGRIDTWYLAHLSEDAIPGMAGLPDAVRDCTLRFMAYELGPEPEGWRSWNASRSAGRAELAREMAAAVKC